MAKLSPTQILAIDPGNIESAYVIWDGKNINEKNIVSNQFLIDYLHCESIEDYIVVIEQIRSYGMAVSMSVFDTVFWTGRFVQECYAQCVDWQQIPRMDVKIHICHDSRAKDSNIRQALIDRFEPGLQPRQRPKGILKGLKEDLWAAFALAVTWWDKNMGL